MKVIGYILLLCVFPDPLFAIVLFAIMWGGK